MEIFRTLGEDIERRWRDSNYDDGIFHRIAMEAIESAELLDKVDPWDVVKWVHTTAEIPRQPDLGAAFGNPPITLYFGPRFYLDIYFWTDGTTAVHQHSFCGAFQVLLGGSLHSKFRFNTTREVNPHLLVGNLETVSVELLDRGDIRPILASNRYIHSLFHLERPSVTLVARTGQTPSGLPQFKYLRPHFALDPFFSDPLETRRRQTSALLLDVAHPRADELIGEMLEVCDFGTAFAVLELFFQSVRNAAAFAKAVGVETGTERFEGMLEIVRRRHGDLADLIPDIFDEAIRQNNIINRRSRITGAEHRFFMALLLNLDNRETLLELVARRFPEMNPIETVMEWIEELSNMRLFGSHETNVLGISEYDEDYRVVLQGLFEGMSLDQIKSKFVEEFPEDVNDETMEKLGALFDSIPREHLFRAIFSGRNEMVDRAEIAREVNQIT